MRTALRGAAVVLLLQIASAHVGIAGEVVQVTINDLAFSPAEITVKAGDTVEWVNNDFIDHTATATSGEWDVMIVAGQSARQEMTKPGTIKYFCRAHPDMTGTITIVNK
jgi:plastocyanin